MNRFLLAALLALLAAPARADQPVQLALFDPVQLVPDTQSVSGLRLTLIYSRNVNVTGFDYSFIATHTTGNFKGVQLAPVNIVDKDVLGLQWSWVGLTGGTMRGAQLGLFNKAKRVEGLQLGLVNYAGTIHGIQIGFVNIIEQGGWLPVMVIVNGNLG
ncbi:MAG TPA: hypothetical protein VF841_20225 [Anaeromyxobacter sp.]